MESKYAPGCMRAPIKRVGLCREMFQEAETGHRADKEYN